MAVGHASWWLVTEGSLATFRQDLSGRAHPAYASSLLLPVAPEYTTGENLIASAYRTLLTDERDAVVDLADIDDLPERLRDEIDKITPPASPMPFHEAWVDLVRGTGGLTSPTPRGANSSRRLKQLNPLVPELSHVAGVLGRVRSRWQPGNLLVSTIWSGEGPTSGSDLVEALAHALEVGRSDDYFAQFLENCLAPIERLARRPDFARKRTPPERLRELGDTYLPAWRAVTTTGRTPSERFTADLKHVLGLKERLTRRQWLALLESLMRLGMGTHQLWLCRLNWRFWSLCLEAYSGRVPNVEVVEEQCWQPQPVDEPLLRLGEDPLRMIRVALGDFAIARVGVNLALYALQDAGVRFDSVIGKVTPDSPSPAHALHAFLVHLARNRQPVARVLAVQEPPLPDLAEATWMLVDNDDRFRRGRATLNLTYFIRYTLGQLQPMDDLQRQYDQGYLIQRLGKRGEKLLVQPAPAMLILLVHCCCQSRGVIPASMEDLREHLATYGIGALPDELRSGTITRNLERLGLVVDSPDAGGGRLLVDPFAKG